MKTALIFGGNGYLGRNLAYALKQSAVRVTCVGRGVSSEYFSEPGEYVQADVTKLDDLKALDFKVDYIFVFSGLTGTNNGFDIYEKFVQVNELGLLNILNRIEGSGSQARVVFPSTRLVYKGVKDKPLSENDEKEAKTVYAQNKLTCEGFLEMYRNYYGIEYTVYRVCVPYGNMVGDTYSYGTIGFFLKQALEGKDITLFGDGSLRRTFTHVSDIFGLIVESIDKQDSVNQCFNVGGPDDLSLLQAATLVADIYGVGVAFIDWPEAALKVESGDTIFDGSRLEALASYQYQNTLADWLQGLTADN